MSGRVEHLAEGVTLMAGDCLDVLKTIEANSVDACVTDPPYHLTANKKGGSGIASLNERSPAGRSRITTGGFMGKQWDGGDIAFRPDVWREVWRVLKPGGHLLSFGGTRTYHRMACAIEDAGFEIRDCIQWLYGSGFPKSHDVSKGIDRLGPHRDYVAFPAFAKHYAERRKAMGMTHAQICELGRFYGTVNHGGNSVNWESGLALPTVEQWEIIAPVLTLDASFKERVAREQYEREVLGHRQVHRGVAFTSEGPAVVPITAPGCDAAREWSGFGTALKPACEPIVLARKPLSESTVAANVLKWGTGALNIKACRVLTAPDDQAAMEGRSGASTRGLYKGNIGIDETWKPANGRWPANVIHDGGEEVLAAFPDAPGQQYYVGPEHGDRPSRGIYGDFGARPPNEPRNDSGSAVRFFYTAKADQNDRLGSKHPTVKPLDLMQYLVRLVTPPCGLVLDPFAGTGTTAEAAFYEGFRAILIEREAEYQDDIRRRMKLCLAGPVERSHESIKAKMKDKPIDAGPLFGGGEVLA